LKEDHWAYIWTWIPKKYRSYDVTVIYSGEKHGFNLGSLYDHCETNDPQIMVIETVDGEIFGAFLSDAWENNTMANRFFGNAESTSSNDILTCFQYRFAVASRLNINVTYHNKEF
jgi:hypothetical protein